MSLVETLLTSRVELRETPQIHVRALELARALGQVAVYDSHYLICAEGLDCGMCTSDETFFRVTTTVSFAVNWIGNFDPVWRAVTVPQLSAPNCLCLPYR